MGSVETLFGSHTMNSICLEKELFSAAERLATILSCRMVPVTMAGGDAGDGRSSTFVCSAAFEKKLGGQEAVVAKGRAMRAGQLMIIAEDQPSFAISEEFGGKLVRLSLPKTGSAKAICDDYGLQLAATLLSSDEISEMPMSLQAKLLRVLQEKAVTPIGSHADVAVDVRVVATTNRNMTDEIRKGNFREDLYYRLNVFPLNTTAVAYRGDDIVPIVTFLLNRHSTTAATIPWLEDSAVAKLRGYSWPGNVRELENVLQRALVLSVNGTITAAEIITDDSLHLMAGQQLAMAESAQVNHGAMAAHR